MRKRALVVLALALPAAFLAAGFAGRGVAFTVKNVGTEPMRSVVVHVTGRSYPIGDLAPGASESVKVNPTGESHIALSVAGGPRLVVDTYLENGDTGKITAEVTGQRVVRVHEEVRIGALYPF